MTSRVDNGFTTYEFDDAELISAATFSILQKMYIQTQRAMQALEEVGIPFDPDKPTDFVDKKAYCRGFIAACDFFLDHEDAEAAKDRWADLQQVARP